MGYKVFVSYKYKDRDVAPLPNVSYFTWCRDYVDYIANNILSKDNHVYKGEDNTEDLSDKSENYIWNHLKDKIYDSSVTIVLLTPNMKEPGKWQRSQWIPWKYHFLCAKRLETDVQAKVMRFWESFYLTPRVAMHGITKTLFSLF